jgi:hypothetical protein
MDRISGGDFYRLKTGQIRPLFQYAEWEAKRTLKEPLRSESGQKTEILP